MSVTATGGVRNLRAIFENKSVADRSYSSSSRGSSSSGSVASASSRPVSSVRTSFIAVVDTPGPAEKTSASGKMAEATREESSNIATGTSDALPASPHQTTHPIEGGLGVILKGSPFEGSRAEPETSGIISRAAAMVQRINSRDKPALNSTPTAPSPRQTVATPNTLAASPSHNLHIRGGPAKINGILESVKKAREAREAPKQEQTGKSPTAASAKAPAETGAQAQPGIKVPLRKVPLHGGTAKIQGIQESARQARQAREAAAEQSNPQAQPQSQPQQSTKAPSRRLPAAATATTASRNAATAAAPIESTQKPAARPRLSVPAKLPSAVTAKTAASAAKTETERSSKLRQSTSRASLAACSNKVPAAATAVTASMLAKKASRVSLSNGDHSKSRPSSAKPPDDSFLARMSRPTVSSASKTHDKAEAKGLVNGSGKAAAKAHPRPAPATSSRSRGTDQSEATTSERNGNAATANGAISDTAPTSNGTGVLSVSAADPAPEA